MYLHFVYVCAHLHTTSADTVHTPHTDEWLVASKIVFHGHWNEKVVILSFYFEVLLLIQHVKITFWLFCFRALSAFSLFIEMLPLVLF